MNKTKYRVAKASLTTGDILRFMEIVDLLSKLTIF